MCVYWCIWKGSTFPTELPQVTIWTVRLPIVLQHTERLVHFPTRPSNPGLGLVLVYLCMLPSFERPHALLTLEAQVVVSASWREAETFPHTFGPFLFSHAFYIEDMLMQIFFLPFQKSSLPKLCSMSPQGYSPKELIGQYSFNNSCLTSKNQPRMLRHLSNEWHEVQRKPRKHHSS